MATSPQAKKNATADLKEKLFGSIKHMTQERVEDPRWDRAQEVLGVQDRGGFVPGEVLGTPELATIDPVSAVTEQPQSALERKYGVPEYVAVPLTMIDDNPFNARHFYDPEVVSEFARRIATEGQLSPGMAVKRGDRYVLIAGHYRRRALTMAGVHTMRLMVYPPMEDQDLYVLSFKENDERKDQTALDNAMAWRNLLDKKVFDNEDALAQAIGMSRSNITKTLKILEIDPEAHEVIRQNPAGFALSVLYELYLLQKVADSHEVVHAANAVLADGIGRKEIAQMRERIENQRDQQGANALQNKQQPTRINNKARTYRLFDPSGKTKQGEIKEWDTGRLVVDVTITDPRIRAMALEEFRNRLAELSALEKSSELQEDDLVIPRHTAI